MFSKNFDMLEFSIFISSHKIKVIIAINIINSDPFCPPAIPITYVIFFYSYSCFIIKLSIAYVGGDSVVPIG
jgi:hypothetical protein